MDKFSSASHGCIIKNNLKWQSLYFLRSHHSISPIDVSTNLHALALVAEFWSIKYNNFGAYSALNYQFLN